MKKLALALAIAMGGGAALAKLPPPSDEAKTKADEAKARTAWSDKVAAYKLCLSQDKAVANYRKVKGKDAKPVPAAPASMPACQDPGPYVPPVAAASSAPAGTAASAVVKAGSATSPPAKK